MEIVRLKLRHQKLLDTKSDILSKTTRPDEPNLTIAEEELISLRVRLHHAIDAFDKELRAQSNIEPIELTTYMEDQMQAEELLIRLDSIYSMYQNSQKQHPTVSRLPKLEWEKYRGDILKFSEFWDKFEANIDSRNLKDVEKFSYLIGSLEGPALDSISGLATTNANYSIAVDILKQKYGSKSLVIDAHHSAINNIKRSTDDHYTCRQTLDTLERHLRVLHTLGENMESNHLRVTIASKFPERIMYQVNLLSPDDHSVPTLRSNLSRVVTAMERSGSNIQRSADTSSSTSTTEALHTRTEVAANRSNFKRKHDTQANGPPSKRPKYPCIFCKMGNHTSTDCKRFKTIEARKAKLKGRCLVCLRRNHQTEKCQRQISCFRCKGNHFQMLCPKQRDSMDPITNTVQSRTTICEISNEHTLLQTAVVTIYNPCKSKKRTGRLLLDSGSQRSYITSKTAKLLGLSTVEEDLLLVYTFGAETPREMSSPSAEVIIKTKRGNTRKIRVNIVPHITDRIPVSRCNHDEVDIMADDDSVGESIDILVGNDLYCSFLHDDKIKIKNNLYLINTDFGWIVSGKTTRDEFDVLSVTTYCQCHTPNCPYFTEPDLPLRNIDIKFLWSLESLGITDSPKATRQEQAVSHFNETVQYRDGRYEIKWPWIQYPPELPSNFGLALGRLRSLIKRLDADSLSEYNAILKEQLDLGIIEFVEPQHSDEDHPIHYLPHHMVRQKGKRGRIVYDASAKVSGQKSLNECLYSGPSMLEDLTGLLLKFRTKKIGIVADVEKAFLQVGLQQIDRDVTRFLWIRDPRKEIADDNLLHLRFCRVPFGIISSPFLLTAAIRHHISQSGSKMLKSVADKCYVDNLVTGADTVDEAGNIYELTRSTFGQLSMNIRDWVSNSREFMEKVPEQYKTLQPEEIKVLGLKWDVKADNLKLKVPDDNFNTTVNTKREVLRTLARVYDPCGFVCPLMLPIKLLFQRICQEKIKWDMPLPEDFGKELNLIIVNLRAVTEIVIPRYLGTDLSDINVINELHCYTDASCSCYAAVVYLRTQGNQKTSVLFVMAKSRVSQIQDRDTLKIPKLELLGFLIGSRLLKYVKANLDIPITKQYLWTDSLVVLGWMKSNKLLPPFVANRVNEIKQNHPDTEMYYINTKLNPADIATRPEPELWDQKKGHWFNGPAFLTKEESCWPASRYYDAHRTLFSSGEALDGCTGVSEPQDYSQLERAHEITMEIDDPNTEEERLDSSHDNLLNETMSVIKKLQYHHFPEELANKRTHLAKNLDLFLDANGILRCRGRMANTSWSFDKKYPILLPKNSEFTNELIIKTHESNYHVGASHTLNIIREQYWIPQGKAKVIKVLKSCKQCVKHGSGPYKLPDAPPLPPERVNFHEPYSFTGLDYFGPLFVSSPTGEEKRWVALFTCLTVRAIHLEIVKDLTAEECHLALRRMAATRGIPKRIYSDNATCFKLTSEVMTKPYCLEKGIQWYFIPQLAPWHGGYYERLVRMVKHCLKRTLAKHLLTESKLLTILKEIEAVVNSRPLTRVGTEVEHILRPADFLSLGKCLTPKTTLMDLSTSGSKTKSDLIEGWKTGLKILEEFKKMFINQYLISLRERSQHTPKQPRIRSDRTPQIGDLVQIKADSKNRENWKVGKIDALIEGADGKCRVAKVKVDDTMFTRSIGHLYPLEDDVDGTQPCDEQKNENEQDANRGVVDIPLLDIEASPTERSTYGEVQPQTDTSTCLPEITCPMETESGYNRHKPRNTGDEVTTAQDISTNESVPCMGTASEDNLQPSDVTRNKRDAAIRARRKILEWTRQLLALLK